MKAKIISTCMGIEAIKEMSVPTNFTEKTYARFEKSIQDLELSFGRDEDFADFELVIKYQGVTYFLLNDFAIKMGYDGNEVY